MFSLTFSFKFIICLNLNPKVSSELKLLVLSYIFNIITLVSRGATVPIETTLLNVIDSLHRVANRGQASCRHRERGWLLVSFTYTVYSHVYFIRYCLTDG